MPENERTFFTAGEITLMNFIEMLNNAWDSNNSLVCVGLDVDPEKFPSHIKNQGKNVFSFNKAIVNATSALVCAYKPQIAYYSARGTEDQLKMTIDYIHEHAPGIPVILDAKRGDIGNTSKMYAIEAFDRYGADAVTVNPFLGKDSLEPFLERKDRGVILLCKTSNPSATDIQDFSCSGVKLYTHIARMAAETWNYNNNISLVVGATYPEELAQIRTIIGDMPLLVPGIGAQGGDIESTVKAGRDSHGKGMMINSSRGIIYAGSDRDFDEKAKDATIELRDKINLYR